MCQLCKAFDLTPGGPSCMETADGDGGDNWAGDATTSMSMAPGGVVTGSLQTADDVDWIAIDLEAGERYTVDLEGYGSDGVYDTYLRIWSPGSSSPANGWLLTYDDDGGAGLFSQSTFTAALSGRYYIDVQSYNGWYAGQYRLSVTHDSAPDGPSPEEPWTYGEIADQLVNGYWNANGQANRAFLVGDDNAITVDITTLNATYQGYAREALQTWTDITGVAFTEVSGFAEITFQSSGSGSAYNSSSTTGTRIIRSIINVSEDWERLSGPDYTYQTFIHEIGHAIGLGHAGNYNGSADYGIDNDYVNDSWQASIMSYFSQYENSFVDADFNYLLTPMVADVIAAQTLYGASTTTRSGDTVYGFNSTAGDRFSFDQWRDVYGRSSYALTLTDSDGVDTLDLSGTNAVNRINLAENAISDIMGGVGSLAIGAGTQIENAIGGGGADWLTGNGLQNQLIGGDGSDSLTGGAGVDDLRGGAGNDTYIWSRGDGADQITESSQDGDDSLSLLDVEAASARIRRADTLIELEILGEGAATLTLFDSAATIAQEGVETVRFSDGVAWNRTFLEANAHDLYLSLDQVSSESFGDQYNNLSDSDGAISAAFSASADSDLTLRFKGYDINDPAALSIALNGVDLGFDQAGADQALSDFALRISSRHLQEGGNTLTFSHDSAQNTAWGLTAFQLTEAPQEDLSLVLGERNSGEFGNYFNDARDDDGVVTAAFNLDTARELRLSLSGYDIDSNREVELFVNEQRLGFLAAGVDRGQAEFEFQIAAETLTAGENLLTFRQQANPNWAWGVTDILLTDAPSVDAALTLGEADQGFFGNGPRGSRDIDGAVFMSFTSTGDENLVLDFQGYDIDGGNELELRVNDQSVAFFSGGENNGFSAFRLDLSADLVLSGENTLSFHQTVNPNWAWGVADILLRAEPEFDVELTLGQTESRAFGNYFNGMRDSDGVITARFDADGGQDLRLSLQGYDIDGGRELALTLNGAHLGYLGGGADRGLSDFRVEIAAAQLQAGENQLEIRQAINAAYAWGVTDLLIEEAPENDFSLTLGETLTTSFGNYYNGSTDANGLVRGVFNTDGASALTLSFKGFDIDSGAELELLVNDESFMFLDAGRNGQAVDYQVELDAALLNAGENSLTFRQAINPAWAWGVGDVLLEETPEGGAAADSFDFI